MWNCVALGDDGRPVRFTVVRSDDHPLATRIELPEREAAEAVGPNAAVVAELDADGAITSLVVTALAAPKTPDLWFAELPEPDATPPAGVLVAFTGHGLETGRLVDRDAVADAGAGRADQIGAVRWYPATGEIDQVYVQPGWRRRGVSSAMLAACDTINVVRGGPSLWADGQRTADGERFAQASPWRDRGAKLSHLAPPMTPIEQR